MKIYGFNENDANGLIQYLKENQGKSKVSVFSDYATKIGKSKGTIRNLYYAIVKAQKGLDDSFFKVKRIERFNPLDEKNLIDKVNAERQKGRSVRSIINQMANGDDVLFLRYQNKYRNYLKKTKPSISNSKKPRINEVQLKRLKSEINGLVERLLFKERQENARLIKLVKTLEDENQALKQKRKSNSIMLIEKTI